MKKTLLLFAAFCALQVNAQKISFEGTGLTAVQVENLTSGIIVNLAAGEVLNLGGSVGINNMDNKSTQLRIFPNPMIDNSILEFVPPVAGDVVISMYDMAGKTLAQYKGYVENYPQEFKISGMQYGLYLMNVQGNGFRLSEKLFCKGNSGMLARIEKSGSKNVLTQKKAVLEPNGVKADVPMLYVAGERLKFTATAGNNKTVMTDVPTETKTIAFSFVECKDADENYYPVVQIGTQLWMGANLKTTKYRNGDVIATTEPAADISAETTPKYQWPVNGDEANVATHGRVYTWDAATDSRNIAPVGWHVADSAEYNVMIKFIGGLTGTAAKLKQINPEFLASSIGATNEFGFTLLRTGQRSSSLTPTPGAFTNFATSPHALLWSASPNPNDATQGVRYRLQGSTANIAVGGALKYAGFGVRCVKDAPAL